VAVSTLTRTARDVMEGAFAPLWIRGEVCDFKAHRNGHWYFCLRDATAQMRCVVWSRDQLRIPAPPDEGMQLCAFGQLSVYAARGDMQFVITAMEASGEGLWRKALEKARARLEADGLLRPERKRPLPRFPQRVAVVTSPDGAALHDIVSVIRRRCSSVQIVVVPVRVQGEGAAEEIVAALGRVGRWRGADTVIVGRGGGAREDLWVFNDERVARAVAACPIPTISAVGHEVDVSLCDLVADLRAATPSAAAEAAVPVLDEERAFVNSLGVAMKQALTRRARRAREGLLRTERTLRLAATRVAERRRARLETLSGQLHALSPLATLARGYAVARDADGRALASAEQFAPGDPFTLHLRDGKVDAITDRVTRTDATRETGRPKEGE
jgi:exodeoxyribonuclease VII large subunit